MEKPVRILFLAWCVVIACSEGDKPQYTRTALHVARSLDPESTETMTVRTRTGDVATLIVKKRNGRQRAGVEGNLKPQQTKSGEETIPSPVYVTSAPLLSKDDKKSNSNPYYSIRDSKSDIRVPEPVYITSSILQTKNKKDEGLKQDYLKRDAKSNIRVPDPVYITSSLLETKDEKDIKKVDEETPNRDSRSNYNLPIPVYIRSNPVLVKGQQNDLFNKHSRNLMKIDSDGIPVVTGVRMPDDESDKYVWRNARVINNILVPSQKTASKQNYDSQALASDKKKIFTQSGLTKLEPIKQNYNKPEFMQYNGWNKVEGNKETYFNPTEVVAVVDAPTLQEWHSVEYPQEYVKIIEEPEQISEEDRIIRDKILDYIKNVNNQETSNRHFSRNTRMLQDQPRMEARVLHNPGNTVYPTSLLYSPPSSQPSRVSFEEGVRTPVLQYAHPELGVQPANVATAEDNIENNESDKSNGRREQALAYFSHDIYADRSPYAFEPGLEEEARVDINGNNKRSNSGGLTQRPKKTLSYFYPDQAVTDSYSNKYSGKYNYGSPNYGYKSGYQATMVRPFWERLSDTIREHVQTGMERVQEMTRPVMDPLVEASQKISHNLGLGTGNREFSTIKEKLGVAGSPSVLFPALGLVAGGAALGLGAVAVGRYLDVDMLMRSKNSDLTLDDFSLEHKRAMEAIAASTIDRSLQHEEKPTQTPSTRRRRSVDRPEEVMEKMIQTLEGNHEDTEGVITPPGVWTNTPCAKKVFCQVMSQQTDDAVMLMEKKMATYLHMIHPSMTDNIGYHLDDVMSAVKRRDCSAFQCTAAVPTRSENIQHLPMPR